MTISFLCGEKTLRFAPKHIMQPRKNYLPFRSVKLQTTIPSLSKVKITGYWDGDISHEYAGRYEVNDKLSESIRQQMRRDIICLHKAGIRTLKVLINGDTYDITINHNTYQNLKNLILKLLKINLLCKI